MITNAPQQDLIYNGRISTTDRIAHEINIITDGAGVVSKQRPQWLQTSGINMGLIKMGQHVRK